MPAVKADHVVAMGEWAASDRPGDVLTCVGVGSCIALLLIDSERAIASLAHVVVPGSGDGPPAKYADSAVPELVHQTTALGAGDLVAALVGGAAMFDFGPGEPIGARNEQAVRAGLERAGIPVVACDTGGSRGRTVRATIGPETEVRVRTSGQGEALLGAWGPAAPAAGLMATATKAERVIASRVIG